MNNNQSTQPQDFSAKIIKLDLLKAGGKKDTSKLIKKRIVNAKGHVQTVYVAPSQEYRKKTKEQKKIEAELIRKKEAIEQVKRELEAQRDAEKKHGSEAAIEAAAGVSSQEAPKNMPARSNSQPSGLGRHKELYGFHTGDIVTTKFKGQDVSGSIQYWNVNKSTPNGYAVVVLEDGTKIERTNGSMVLKTPVGAEGHQPITKESIRENLNGAAEQQQSKESIHNTDVNKRFDTMVKMVKAVGRKLQKSLIIYGSGGTGKTYTVTKEFEKMGKVPYDEDHHVIGGSDYDYIAVTGKVSPAALFRIMYEHNGKTILFDDCDSFLKDADAVNTLKGALDTSGDGTISWQSQGKVKDSNGEEIPKRFKFNGNAIFISNLDSDKVPQPLKSRSLRIDMTMSKEDTVKRIEHILDKIDFSIPGVTPEDKQEALNYLAKNLQVTDDVNVRTLKSLLVIKKTSEEEGDNWKESAKHFLLSKAGEDFGGIVMSLDEYMDIQKAEVDLNGFSPKKLVDPEDGVEKIVFIAEKA